MDLVVNHSSDEHEWFKRSRQSRTNPYRNYYHWWNAERGVPPYRYSLFDVNHDAWRYDSATKAYYLHYFSRKQPDLNWENPRVRQEVYDIMRFWADKGIDGFRLDAFQFVAKDTTWPVWPEGWEKHFMDYYAMGPHLHDYLQEMNREVLSRYPVMSVAEGAGNSFADAHALVDADRRELNMAYAFDAVDIAKSSGYSLLKLKEVFTRWDSAFAENGWLAIFLANHDQARLVSRFGNDRPPYRTVSSKMLSTFLLTMRGTPFYYNGDELGMSNPGFNKISDFRDVAALNEYRHLETTGGDLAAYLKEMSFSSRDNSRTPMQWDAGIHAGFTRGKPWIGVNPNYSTVNVAAEERDPNSCLQYFRRLTRLRKENPVLVYGKYTLLDKDNPDVYAYTREWKGVRWLVVLNFTSRPVPMPAPVSGAVSPAGAKLMIDNYASAGKAGELRPYEAAVYALP
jgi:oligo-1,6-glucosidase